MNASSRKRSVPCLCIVHPYRSKGIVVPEAVVERSEGGSELHGCRICLQHHCRFFLCWRFQVSVCNTLSSRVLNCSCLVSVSTMPQVSLPMALLQRPVPQTQIPQYLRTQTLCMSHPSTAIILHSGYKTPIVLLLEEFVLSTLLFEAVQNLM